MRTLTCLFLTMITGVLAAQTPVNQTYAVPAGKKISFHFDYPELVRISTWDKNEISITGSVSINGGESDSAFELTQSTSDNVVSIENRINNLKNLPHRITVTRGEEKIIFKTEADYKKYVNETGQSFNVRSQGVEMDIILEIKVPKNVETRLESVYGLVEVKSFAGPLRVEATYGGVDVSVQEQTTGELIAETNYGQIYSNLTTKFGGEESDKDFHTFIEAKPGKGPRYSFESKYGNVYLRKQVN